MKNPFKKEENNGLWIAAAIGTALVTGAAAFIYTIGCKVAAARAYRREHAQDYLEAKQGQKKRHKSDVHDLANIIQHNQA